MNFQISHATETAISAQNYNQLIDHDIQDLLTWSAETRSGNKFSKLKKNNYTVEDFTDAVAFNAAYGNMHTVKMVKVLNDASNKYSLDRAFFGKFCSINIYDWGAGQGLATAMTLDFLANENLQNFPIRVFLIEPSLIATIRAKKLLINMKKSLGFNNLSISIYNINADLVEDRKLVGFPGSGYNIHLFSNVLDLLNDVKGLCEHINNHSKNDLLFICVGPVSKGIHTLKCSLSIKETIKYENLKADAYSYTQSKINQRPVCSHSLTFQIKK